MATLGEAFIAIRADLRPFTKDLDKETKKITDRLEGDISKAVSGGVAEGAKDSGKSGDKIGDDLGKKLKDKLGDKKKPPWINIASALGGALDDGISALPAEVKAGIVLGILAAIPVAGAFLTAALAAAIVVGVAGLGVALASQFKDVQNEAARVFANIREIGISSAGAFEQATVSALQIIERKFIDLEPKLTRIFNNTANLAPILAGGVAGFIDEIVTSIEALSKDLGPFGVELSRGFIVLGDAVGYALETIVATGEDGRRALRDLLAGLAEVIAFTADALAFLTGVYSTARDIFNIVGGALTGDQFGPVIDMVNDAASESTNLAVANQHLASSIDPVIKLTDAQEKQMAELEKTIKKVSDATFSLIQDNVDYERALDNITESIAENGRTLDITTEKGRQNTEAFLAGISAAEQRAKDRVESGKLTAEQAAAQYNAEIEQIRTLARQLGITEAAFNKTFAEATNLAKVEINPSTGGINALYDATKNLSAAIGEALNRAGRLQAFRLPTQGTRPFSEYADGDIITRPTLGLVGEAGPEVIIPLTKPARAAQLMRDSGLASMLGGNSSNIAVYIGNEQLDARMYRIAEQNTKSNSLSLSYGAR